MRIQRNITIPDPIDWDRMPQVAKIDLVKSLIQNLKTADFNSTLKIVTTILHRLAGPNPETEFPVLSLLIIALGEVKFQEMFPTILDTLSLILVDRNALPQLRKQVALVIGHLGQDSTIDLLVNAYPPNDELVVKEAICQAVANIGGENAYGILAVAIMESEEQLRSAGWQHLATVFKTAHVDPDLRALFINVCNHETDARVQARARQALRVLEQHQAEA